MATPHTPNNRPSPKGVPRKFDKSQPFSLHQPFPQAPVIPQKEGKNRYACEAPYPPIQVGEKNQNYAQTVSIHLASAHSELSAILQYCYQNWILLAPYPNIASDLAGISKVEMHHLSILGRTITLLGGDPRFIAPSQNHLQPWNSNFLSYEKQIKSILLLDIQSEHDTIHAYMSLAEKLKDPYLAAIFKRLSLDEEVHLNLLRQHLGNFS